MVREIYRVTRYEAFRHDRGLVDQIQRASVSITSNIAEGHERGTTRDLILYLYYAKGSAGEVRSQLWNAEDTGYITVAEGTALRANASDVSRQIYGWVTSMQVPEAAPGPLHHQRPSRGEQHWQQVLQAYGIVSLPNGRCVIADRPSSRGAQ